MLRKLFCKFIKILLLFIPGSFWNGHEWDNIRNISLNLRLYLTLKLRVLLSTEMECLRGNWWGSQPAMTFFLVLRVVFALTHTHPPPPSLVATLNAKCLFSKRLLISPKCLAVNHVYQRAVNSSSNSLYLLPRLFQCSIYPHLCFLIQP